MHRRQLNLFVTVLRIWYLQLPLLRLLARLKSDTIGKMKSDDAVRRRRWWNKLTPCFNVLRKPCVMIDFRVLVLSRSKNFFWLEFSTGRYLHWSCKLAATRHLIVTCQKKSLHSVAQHSIFVSLTSHDEDSNIFCEFKLQHKKTQNAFNASTCKDQNK